MAYVAGWDGGGSKTAAVCLDLAGAQLMRESFGPLNPNGTESSAIEKTIRSTLGAMGKLPGGLSACRYLTVGAAGVSNPKVTELISSLIRKSGYTGPLNIVGDHEILLYGAVGREGAVLIAGTGSVCIGRNAQGHMQRSGGLGYLIGDEGSGYWIGLKVLCAVTRSLDGRGPETLMTAPLLETLQCDSLRGIIGQVYGGELDKSKIAALSRLLIAAIRQKDETALDIARSAADELCLLAGTVVASLGLEDRCLALSGGLLSSESSPLYLPVVERIQRLYPALQIISPRTDAAKGAALIALDLLNS